MMNAINEDLYSALLSAKVPEEQARAAARSVLGPELLATKTDIAELRSEFKASIAELRNEFNTEIAGLRVRLEQCVTKGELAATKTELQRWMVTGFIAQTAVLLAVLGLFVTA